MNEVFLNLAQEQLATEARTSLGKRVQHFIERTQQHPDDQGLHAHAEVVADAAHYLDMLGVTDGFGWTSDGGQKQIVIGTIEKDNFFLSVSDEGEKRKYSAQINGKDVTPKCAEQLWNAYGVPTRRRHVTAKLLGQRS